VAFYKQFAKGRHRVKAVGFTVQEGTIFDSFSHRFVLTLEILDSKTMVVGDRVALMYTIKPGGGFFSAGSLANVYTVAQLKKYFRALQGGYHANNDGTLEEFVTFIETHRSVGRQHIVDVEASEVYNKVGRPFVSYEWFPVSHTTPSIVQWGEPKVVAHQKAV
jgi:hypothetical protein